MVVALVLLPLVATLATWWGLAGETRSQATATGIAEGGSSLAVEATALNVDRNLGEMPVRLVVVPSGDLADVDGLLEDITLVVNDQSGQDVRTLRAGTSPEALTIVVGLEGNSSRYPFDTYAGNLTVAAAVESADSGADLTPLPVELTFTAALEQFRAASSPMPAESVASIDIDLDRRWTSITWVVFFMVICWAIALCCVGVVWWVVVYGIEIPFWTYTLFAAVLFALPILRSGLPGSPAYGVLVDWAAFYWSIGLVAIALISVLLLWISGTRSTLRSAVEDGTLGGEAVVTLEDGEATASVGDEQTVP